MADRFLFPYLVTPADPGETTAQLDERFASAQAALNTLDAEANLLSFHLHGVGRVEGCVLDKDAAGILRIPNGWFLAGSGREEGDEDYFVGARLVRVNGAQGYIELLASNAPPPNATSYGHMTAIGDVVWSPAPLVGADGKRPGGRWLIGQVVTDASGAVTTVDATLADVVGQKPVSTGGGGGNTTALEFWEDLKWSRLDPRSVLVVFAAQIADLEAQIAKLSVGVNQFPAPFDILADHIAILMAGLAEVNPPAVERGQISVVVANAGKGQNDTPNYSPDTNDPLELPFDAVTGLFGP